MPQPYDQQIRLNFSSKRLLERKPATLNYSDVLDLIRFRRSIFPPQFESNELSEKEVQQLLELCRWAPNHRHTEPWYYKVFMDDARLKLGQYLQQAYREKAGDRFTERKFEGILKKCEKSGAVIAICLERDEMERVPEWEELAALSMSVQNLWLGAGSLGLAGYWSSPSYVIGQPEFLNLNTNQKCYGLFYLGRYSKKEELAHRAEIKDHVEIIRE